MLNDPLASALSKIMNAERRGRQEVEIKPSSKILKNILKIMNEKGYIGDFEEIENGRGNIIKINLIGKINGCNAIKPRYPVGKDEFEKYEKRYLPAKGFGVMFVSTPFGIIIHTDAKEKNTGGVLLGYCY